MTNITLPEHFIIAGKDLVDTRYNNSQRFYHKTYIVYAIHRLNSLVDCYNCHNCVNCKDCHNCNNCTTCTDCRGCHRCDGCNNSQYCVHCTNLERCTHCIHCSYLTNCDELKWTRHCSEQPLLNVYLSPWTATIRTDLTMCIGCQDHSSEDWASFDDDAISDMHEDAVQWWNKHKQFLLNFKG